MDAIKIIFSLFLLVRSTRITETQFSVQKLNWFSINIIMSVNSDEITEVRYF